MAPIAARRSLTALRLMKSDPVETAAIAPIVYIQLLVATAISVFVFGDPIDRIAMIGGSLIVFGGAVLLQKRGLVLRSV